MSRESGKSGSSRKASPSIPDDAEEGGERGAVVDLNGDIGESFGVYVIGDDAALLDSLSSANIACGFHAGDPSTMRRTVRLALEKGVAVGAHPGYPDLQGFGRREMAVTPQEAHDLTLYQVAALAGIAKAEGAALEHVKPHGALYNQAATNPELADAVARAVQAADPALILFGLSGSELIRAGERIGLRTASEVFADRACRSDGSLASRRLPGAFIEDPGEAAARAARMIREGCVATLDGTEIAVRADTLCVHGDNPRALAFARSIRAHLERESILIRGAGEFLRA
jgi:UPF0271 protein